LCPSPAGLLTDPSGGEPVLYTENLFVKFIDTADEDACREVLRENGLTIKQEVSYATNAFFVEAAEGIGRKVFDVAQALLQRDDVEYCHPDLIRPRARKAIVPQQWHLKKTAINGVTVDAHANLEAAHQVTRGEGITIAISDDGVGESGGGGMKFLPSGQPTRDLSPRPPMPTMHEWRESVTAGGLISYGPSLTAAYPERATCRQLVAPKIVMAPRR
jgi:hypothetical protein